MNSLHSRSVASSTVTSMSDLDGFSVPMEYPMSLQSQLGAPINGDFGFDPPSNIVYPKLEAMQNSPPSEHTPFDSWSGFEDSKDSSRPNRMSIEPNDLDSYELDRMLSQNLLNAHTAISRFGQVTPPRSTSATSDENPKLSENSDVKAVTVDRRKRSSKASAKEEAISSSPNNTTTTAGRKRKNTRKSSIAIDEQDDKRRQSLEKNRLAAAKCRVNKKEKTEQLQRDSHEKAVHNAFLKEQVMRMKEELQQMNALLLAHANCDGCKSPDEIQKHLNNLGNEFFSQHMPSLYHDDYSQLGMHQDYFGSPNQEGTIMNPPLPEFNRAAEFDVVTPMQTD